MAWNGSNNSSVKRSPLRNSKKKISCGTFLSRRNLGIITLLVAAIFSAIIFFIDDPITRSEDTVAVKRKIAKAKPIKSRTIVKDSKQSNIKKRKPSDDIFSQRAVARKDAFLRQAKTDPTLQFHMTNTPPSQMVFKTATEQALDVIFNTPVGSSPPPLIMLDIPRYELDKLGDILLQVDKYDKEDSDKVKERKLMVQRAKEEFKKFIDKGGKPRDFLDYYYNELQRCNLIWEESQRVAVEAARFEEPEIARELVEAINRKLAT
jgi:hypothetical protein